jgi:two-component system, chemotaxis family, sensor kinase CheA
MDMSRYREMFLSESRDRLLNMGRLLQAQVHDDQAGIDALFRDAHSLKGMAASMGFAQTTRLAHHLEDLLEQCRQDGQIAPATRKRLLVGVDLLEQLLDDLTAEQPERDTAAFVNNLAAPAPAEELASPAPPLGEPFRTVRIRTELLDRLVDLAGALLTNRYQLQAAASSHNHNQLREGLDQLGRFVGDLQHQVLRARMLPLRDLTGRLPRLVRDLAQRCGKTIALRIEGEGVEIDRTVLEGLADPLMHLLRNAVDHGIEQQGEIVVQARRDKDHILLSVADNGRGLDAVAIREKALSRGIISPVQASLLHQRDLLQLICTPGFSTALKVSDTSGRGVGMDVVRTTVEHMGGTLEIASAPGAGTRFTLRLPAAVAIIHVLLVTCAGHTLGIPASRVHRTLQVPREQLQKKGRQLLAAMRDGVGAEEVDILVPLLSLRKMLGLPTAPTASSLSIVVTEARGRRMGLVVDGLVGQREVFVKSLASPLDQLPGISGSTVLWDGRIVFLLDPPHLLQPLPHSGGAKTTAS